MDEKQNSTKKIIPVKSTRTLGTRLTMLLLFPLVLMLAAASPLQAQSSDLQETLQQYISDLQKNPNDKALREKIIKLALEMKPSPAIPAEAEKSGNRAEYAVKNAKSDADLTDAVKEYEKALLIAPWVAAYYYNLGAVCEKTGQLQNAVRNYKLYLLAMPDAQDTQEVRKQIDGIEYVLEKGIGWAVDPATGCKIGWNNTNFTLRAASWSGPVVDGKAEGKGTLKVSIRGKDGKEIQGSGEVEMSAGLLDGKGSLAWSDKHSYAGYFKNGKRNGRGVMIFSDGQIYAGEWKDDEKVAAPLTVDKVLGIPWDASEKETKDILRRRPNTGSWATRTDKPGVRTHSYHSTYNDSPVMLQVHFYQGKMYAVSVLFVGVNGDQILGQFNAAKQGLSQRYGAPFKVEGSGLGSAAYWALGGAHCAKIRMSNDPPPFSGGPVQIIIQYFNYETANSINNVSGQNSGKDY